MLRRPHENIERVGGSAQSKSSKFCTRLRDADDHRFGKKEDIARVATELNIPVIEHVPFCITIGDELFDISHHERLRHVGVDQAGDRVWRCVGAVKLLTPHLSVQCRERRPRPKHSLQLADRRR